MHHFLARLPLLPANRISPLTLANFKEDNKKLKNGDSVAWERTLNTHLYMRIIQRLLGMI